MVKSESADEESMISSDKISGNEEDDEDCQWSHSQRRASSSGRTGEEDSGSQNGVQGVTSANDDLAGRRMRRQIANCNERRRMQSINAGFQSLRSLLPKRDGEKLSKAAILQHTAEMIQTLQAEKTRLLEEKEAAIHAKKRRLEDEEARERGVVDELTLALEQERRLRQLYEQQLREQRPQSPMLSPLAAAAAVATNANTFGQSQIDNVVAALTSRPDLSGLLQHPLLALNTLVGTNPYLLRPSTTQASLAPAILPVDSAALVTGTRQVADAQNASSFQQVQPTPENFVPTTAAPTVVNAEQLHSPRSLSEANLNAILEAIHHLEGGSDIVNTSPPPSLQQSNVLVR